MKDVATATRNRRHICDARGYCGPFLNESYYASLGDPLWYGTAECVHCRSSVSIGAELAKWESSLWPRMFGVGLAPARPATAAPPLPPAELRIPALRLLR